MKQHIPQQLSLFNKEDNVSDCNTTVSIDPNLPKVWNKYKGGVPEGAVFIGRPSKWGNPYVIGQDGTRAEVIAKFRNYLEGRPDLIQAVKKELAGKHLVCFCSPAPCHGDVWLEIANLRTCYFKE